VIAYGARVLIVTGEVIEAEAAPVFEGAPIGGAWVLVITGHGGRRLADTALALVACGAGVLVVTGQVVGDVVTPGLPVA
jgi:hypothetical protein